MLLSIYTSLTRRKKIFLILGLIALLLTLSGATAYYGSVIRNNSAVDSELDEDKKITANRPGTLSADIPGKDNDASSDSATTPESNSNNSAQQPGKNGTSSGSTGSSTKPGTSSGGSTTKPGSSTGGGSTTKPTTPTPSNPTPTPTCPAGQTGTPPNCVTPPPKPVGVSGNWTLKFQDEFNGTSLNTNLWATQRGQAGGSYGDPYNPQHEDAFYLANNPKVANGNLVLTLNKGTTNGYPYSSGMVQNGRNFSYKYGYTEARVKVPGNAGVWPAYWTLAAPIDQYWPPEIDIFEFGMEGNNTQPWFNYHYGSWPNNSQFGIKRYGNTAVNYSQNFHTYGMLWTPNIIQVYLDGQPGPSYTVAGNITSLPQYLILNLGLKKGANVPSGTAMLVDYVRVWQ